MPDDIDKVVISRSTGSRVTIKVYTLGLGPTPQLLLVNNSNCIVLLPTPSFKGKFLVVLLGGKQVVAPPFIDDI